MSNERHIQLTDDIMFDDRLNEKQRWLCGYIKGWGDDGTYASNEKIAERLGISIKLAKDNIWHLKKLGLIIIPEHRKNAKRYIYWHTVNNPINDKQVFQQQTSRSSNSRPAGLPAADLLPPVFIGKPDSYISVDISVDKKEASVAGAPSDNIKKELSLADARSSSTENIETELPTTILLKEGQEDIITMNTEDTITKNKWNEFRRTRQDTGTHQAAQTNAVTVAQKKKIPTIPEKRMAMAGEEGAMWRRVYGKDGTAAPSASKHSK